MGSFVMETGMRALWFDVFHEGTSIADADKEVLLEENTLAWKSNVEAMNTRFFPVIGDDDENIRGAVVHLQGFSDYPSMVAFTKTVPWIKHGVARGGIYPYGNFVSVQRLFGQNGKYRDVKLIERIQRFETSPTFTWYVVISARKTQLEDYDAQYGLDDALQCFRLLKGEVAEEVFDLHGPFEGKFLRIKANDRNEIESYLREFASVRDERVDILVLRAKSTCVWDFTFF